LMNRPPYDEALVPKPVSLFVFKYGLIRLRVVVDIVKLKER
jgi:hypothetical protein